MNTLHFKSKFIWQIQKLNLVLKVAKFKSIIKLYLNHALNKEYTKLYLKHDNRCVWVRTKNIIDVNVLNYVFNERYHLPPEDILLSLNSTILDIGSNIGATIIDFKKKYPHSTIIAYEMDYDNFQLSLKNCVDLTNVIIYNKPVWHTLDYVFYQKENHTDAFSISEFGSNKIKLESITLDKIILDNNLTVIDYLKMDIEGAEIKIFEDSNLNWLNIVLCLM